MFVVVFRNRLKSGIDSEYRAAIQEMSALAREVPGYISHKAFVAEDGERVTIVEYESEENVRTWARDVRHVAAKNHGRENFYREDKVQICEVLRQRDFQAQEKP